MTNSLAVIPSAALVGTQTPGELARIVEQFERLPALKTAEPRVDGDGAKAVRQGLKAVGMKTWPTMERDRMIAWLNAMVLALSDMPAALTVAALEAAIHQPFRFHNEVEPWVRDKVGLIRKHVNLLPWHAERRARESDQPKLEAPGTRWNQHDVDQANASFAAVGISTRYKLVGEQVETFQAEPNN